MPDLTLDLGVVFAGTTAEKLTKLRTLIASLQELERAWTNIDAGEAHEKVVLDSFMLGQSPLVPIAVGKKVDIYMVILEEHGKPMHVREITAEALRRGAVLRGGSKASPEQKVRNSLYGSKKFVNVGDNTWQIADQPSEEHQARTCANT